MKKNILIVEDEEQILQLIQNRLDSDIYNVDIAIDGQEALLKINSKLYDLITLDIMLPYIDGFKISKAIRKKSYQTLIIMVSALDTQEFKLKGYEFGADDYITKPFSPKELAMKIKTLLKRREEISSQTKIYISNIILDELAKEIKINGFCVDVTPSEYLILTIMIKNRNRVYSRAELTQFIYENNLGEIDERGIDSHIYHIRKKIKIYEEKEIIKTVRGMGYKIDAN